MKASCFAVFLSLSVASISAQALNSPPSASPSTTAAHKIDLNKADLKELTGSFKGIGKKRAEAIISYRESHHGFKAIEELAEVKGLSQHFVDVNQTKLKEVFVLR